MKNSWQCLMAACAIALVSSIPPSLHAAEGVKKEGRFTVNDSGTPWMGDETELLKKFDLHVQWWTLLGEPIEYYDFRWYLNDHYWLPNSGTRITREQLKKYPDLLKRFDAIRPRKVDLLLTGSFSNDDEGKKTAPPVLAPFYSRGNYKYLRTEFAYFIPDRKLMITRSGEVGNGIVPGSPWDWDEFLQYKVFYPASAGFKVRVKDNNGTHNGADALDESSLEYRRKQLREVFRAATKVELFVQIANIEWPMNELESIATRYKEYENGEREPTPQEVVDQRLKEEVEPLGAYNKDDFWSDLAETPEVEYEKFNDGGGWSAKYGLRVKGSGRVTVPATYYSLQSAGYGYYAAKISSLSFKNGYVSPERHNVWVLIDANGNRVLPDTYTDIRGFWDSSSGPRLTVIKLTGANGSCVRKKHGDRYKYQDAVAQITNYSDSLRVVETKVDRNWGVRCEK